LQVPYPKWHRGDPLFLFLIKIPNELFLLPKVPYLQNYWAQAHYMSKVNEMQTMFKDKGNKTIKKNL